MFGIKSFCLFCQRIGKRKKLENRKFSQSKQVDATLLILRSKDLLKRQMN